jgi:hypothetical protein
MEEGIGTSAALAVRPGQDWIMRSFLKALTPVYRWRKPLGFSGFTSISEIGKTDTLTSS